MIKLNIAVLGTIIVLAGLSVDVAADPCPGTKLLTFSEIAAALGNKRVQAVAPNGEEWNEDHCGATGGDLIKLASPNRPDIDPRKKVGTWNASFETIQYQYGNPITYTYDWSLFSLSTGGLCWGDPNNNDEEIARQSTALGAAGPCP